LQGFFDPLNDELIEPERTGISYSFTEDGHYESAYYRAIANPQDPSCPSGIMQWQHGGWVKNADGSLKLTPIAVDGRQLMSTPCNGKNAIYTRYNQSETMQVSWSEINASIITGSEMLTDHLHRNTSNSSTHTTTSRASTSTSSTASP
jgi:hypothetical protein